MAAVGGVRPETRYARSAGLNIAYQVVGDGAFDLVLVSGFVSHLDMDWDDPRSAHLLTRLASFSRLIRFDKRGTGLSDRVPLSELPTLEERMDDVRAVLDAVGSERAALFGYSEGGPLCVLFAATYPGRTSGLVLYATYAKRSDPDEDYPWAPTADERRKYGEQIERDWAWEVDMRRLCPSADADMTRWWAARAHAAASPGAARALIAMNSQIDVRAVLRPSACRRSCCIGAATSTRVPKRVVTSPSGSRARGSSTSRAAITSRGSTPTRSWTRWRSF